MIKIVCVCVDITFVPDKCWLDSNIVYLKT